MINGGNAQNENHAFAFKQRAITEGDSNTRRSISSTFKLCRVACNSMTLSGTKRLLTRTAVDQQHSRRAKAERCEALEHSNGEAERTMPLYLAKSSPENNDAVKQNLNKKRPTLIRFLHFDGWKESYLP